MILEVFNCDSHYLLSLFKIKNSIRVRILTVSGMCDINDSIRALDGDEFMDAWTLLQVLAEEYSDWNYKFFSEV